VAFAGGASVVGKPSVKTWQDIWEQLLKAGFPVYPTMGRAAQAINQFINYHENRAGPRK